MSVRARPERPVSAPRYWTVRRLAAQRLALLPCGRHADPWPCRCGESPRVEKDLDAWAAAIVHLAALRCPAVVPVEALDGLRRRGGLDAQAAAQAHTPQAVAA